MPNRDLLDHILSYMISLKDTSYSDGLSNEELTEKAESELNAMSRCEYLIVFGDPLDMKAFAEREALKNGKTVLKEYQVTVIEDPKE